MLTYFGKGIYQTVAVQGGIEVGEVAGGGFVGFRKICRIPTNLASND
jgi:hypothetical protein